MHKKQFGRMTVSAWLTAEMERSNPIFMLTVGALLTVTGILVRIWVGGPYRTILELGIAEIVPPVWLMTLLCMVWLFVLGCAAGFVLGYRTGHREEKFKGLALFLLLFAAELFWYAAIFGANLLFLGVLISALCLFLSFSATLCFYRVTKFAGMLLFLHDIWLIYILVLSVSILFHG